MLLIPYQHDRMAVRRLPWVSIALVVVNPLVFLAIRGEVEEARVREERALAAEHPGDLLALKGRVAGAMEAAAAGAPPA